MGPKWSTDGGTYVWWCIANGAEGGAQLADCEEVAWHVHSVTRFSHTSPKCTWVIGSQILSSITLPKCCQVTFQGVHCGTILLLALRGAAHAIGMTCCLWLDSCQRVLWAIIFTFIIMLCFSIIISQSAPCMWHSYIGVGCLVNQHLKSCCDVSRSVATFSSWKPGYAGE